DHLGEGVEGSIMFEPIYGAAARVPSEATAFAGREAAYNATFLGVWQDAADDEQRIASARGFTSLLAPWATGGGYINYASESVGDGLETEYGAERYARLGAFECGTVQVPLDYDNANGATISLAVVRLPATDPAHRIGSLFLNPGGPGGSGVDYTLFAGPFLYTDEVRAKFDLVGFDPRGISRSTALRCFGTDKQWAPYFTPFSFPSNSAEEQI